VPCLASISTDERGAALFQKICEVPEYYVTRTEIDILSRHHSRNRSAIGPNVELIGLGTGAGTKTRIVIEALEKPAVYVPVDISEKQLRKSSAFSEDFSQFGNSCLVRRLPAARRIAITASQAGT